MNNATEWQNRERSYVRQALQLVGYQHPAYNLQPVIDLIRQADALGFVIVPKNPNLQHASSTNVGDT